MPQIVTAAASVSSTSTPSTFKKILRWFWRITGGLLMLIIVLLTILILINLRDEKLTPAAQVLLREPTYLVPDAENGFFILRAINADASLDAFSVGKKQVQEEAARYRADPPYLTQNYTPDNYKTSPASVWDVPRCQETLQNCVEEDLRNRKKVTARI